MCRDRKPMKGQSRCSVCHASYMRAWRQNKKRKDAERAYFRGVAALREALVGVFKSIGSAELSGYTAVQIVQNCAAKVPRETFT